MFYLFTGTFSNDCPILMTLTLVRFVLTRGRYNTSNAEITSGLYFLTQVTFARGFIVSERHQRFMLQCCERYTVVLWILALAATHRHALKCTSVRYWTQKYVLITSDISFINSNSGISQRSNYFSYVHNRLVQMQARRLMV